MADSTNTNGSGNGHAAVADVVGPRRGRASGPGNRLADAFDSVERFPVLGESRARVIGAATAETARLDDIVEAVESDVGLTIAVMRAANAVPPVGPEPASIPAAVDVLKASNVLALAGTADTYEFFDNGAGAHPRPEAFRLHALATQRAGDRLARAISYEKRDELAVATLLHDIGRLALTGLHGDYPATTDSRESPEERIRAERSRFGIDHALVGGVLVRRWNFPKQIAVAIERHHADDAEEMAAMVGLADAFAHHAHGGTVNQERVVELAERIGLPDSELRRLLYELPAPRIEVSRASEPCPLSARELDVLRRLSDGKVYKQIAGEMHLSVSTVRTHLHNVYGKIGAIDRAQAVLTARDKGWI